MQATHTHATRSGDRTRSSGKRPDDWVTGGEPMTRAQAKYLKILCEETGAAFEAGLTKAEASKRIDALRYNPGRPLRHAS